MGPVIDPRATPEIFPYISKITLSTIYSDRKTIMQTGITTC